MELCKTKKPPVKGGFFVFDSEEILSADHESC